MPSSASLQLLDKLREESLTVSAGMKTIVMPTASILLPKLVKDPRPAWRHENQAIPPSDVGLDAVWLKAKTLASLVWVSKELIQDGGKELDAMLTKALTAAMAAELDRAVLAGSGTDAEPTGVISFADSDSCAGALPTLEELSEAIYSLRAKSIPFEEMTVVLPIEVGQALDALKDGEQRFVYDGPKSWRDVRKIETPILNTETHGVVALAGRFSSLVVGIRSRLEIEVSNSASDAANKAFSEGKVGVRAWMRADVAALRDDHFLALTPGGA